MGACYSVALSIKVKNEKEAIEALKNKLARGKDERTNYHEDEWQEKTGRKLNTLENLIRIFLCDRNNGMFLVYENKKKEGFTVYDNGFDCCYGWEGVMMEMFEEIAPYLEDGSTFYIEPDNDYDLLEIKDGKVIQTH